MGLCAFGRDARPDALGIEAELPGHRVELLRRSIQGVFVEIELREIEVISQPPPAISRRSSGHRVLVALHAVGMIFPENAEMMESYPVSLVAVPGRQQDLAQQRRLEFVGFSFVRPLRDVFQDGQKNSFARRFLVLDPRVDFGALFLELVVFFNPCRRELIGQHRIGDVLVQAIIGGVLDEHGLDENAQDLAIRPLLRVFMTRRVQ